MLLSAVPVSPAGASKTSPVFDLGGSRSFTVTWTQAGGASIAGTLAVNVSNDVPPYGAGPGTGWSPTNWQPYPVDSMTTLSHDISSPVANYPQAGLGGQWRWLQAAWTYTSGSGGTIRADLMTQDDDAVSS